MHPSTVDTTIVLAHVEGVFKVVEVAHLQVAVDLIKALQLQDYVLDLGRPIRSMRIGSLPATTVSPTTLKVARGPRSHGRQSASTTMLRTLKPIRGIGPDLFEGKPPSLLRLYEPLHIDEEWFRSEACVDAQAIAARALLVVNAEACRLTRRRHAPSFLQRRRPARALPELEVAAEDQLLVLAGEGEGRGPRRPRW